MPSIDLEPELAEIANKVIDLLAEQDMSTKELLATLSTRPRWLVLVLTQLEMNRTIVKKRGLWRFDMTARARHEVLQALRDVGPMTIDELSECMTWCTARQFRFAVIDLIADQQIAEGPDGKWDLREQR